MSETEAIVDVKILGPKRYTNLIQALTKTISMKKGHWDWRLKETLPGAKEKTRILYGVYKKMDIDIEMLIDEHLRVQLLVRIKTDDAETIELYWDNDLFWSTDNAILRNKLIKIYDRVEKKYVDEDARKKQKAIKTVNALIAKLK